MTKSKKSKTRLEWLDILKGILIIFVVLSHSYPPQIYRNFFTPFFLTMFFWASGYTFSLKKNFREFLANKVKRLIVPFLVLGGARVFLAYVIEGGNIVQRIKGFFVQISCKNDELWFVACLITATFLFYAICRLSQKQSEKWQDVIILISAAICLLISMLDMCIWKMRYPWQLEIAGFMLFYMALGYMCRKYEDIFISYLNNKTVVALLSLLYIVLVFGIPNTVDIHSESFEYPFLFVITTILVIAPIIFIAKKIEKTKLAIILIFWGQNTLFYYAFGGSVRVIIYKLFSLGGTENAYIMSFVCTVLTMIILIIPTKIVKRYFPWAVGG